jgi:hypothetical protein
MDLGELLLYLGLCTPAILAAGVLCFLASFIKRDWLRLIARAGLVSIAIAPTKDHHGSFWPAIWGLLAADHSGLESLLTTSALAVPIVYVITRRKNVDPRM